MVLSESNSFVAIQRVSTLSSQQRVIDLTKGALVDLAHGDGTNLSGLGLQLFDPVEAKSNALYDGRLLHHGFSITFEHVFATTANGNVPSVLFYAKDDDGQELGSVKIINSRWSGEVGGSHNDCRSGDMAAVQAAEQLLKNIVYGIANKIRVIPVDEL